MAPRPSQAHLRDRWRSALANISKLRIRSSHGSETRKRGGTVRGREWGGVADLAVVVTVTVAFAAVVPLTISELGEMLQVDWGAGSEQLSDTVPLNALVVPATLNI